jgi:hypothetical protein
MKVVVPRNEITRVQEQKNRVSILFAYFYVFVLRLCLQFIQLISKNPNPTGGENNN